MFKLAHYPVRILYGNPHGGKVWSKIAFEARQIVTAAGRLSDSVDLVVGKLATDNNARHLARGSAHQANHYKHDLSLRSPDGLFGIGQLESG
ncbi:MAG TPA: hypothetical protein VMJ32_11230 [Pirellulales bacterium]|nr:hypothetical protein [Pirellulales bacterium]